MKLKNVLVLAFITLTLIPIVIVSLLMYKSGYELSKESYLRNLSESISVQTNYMTQSIENNMIADYRFLKQNNMPQLVEAGASQLHMAFQTYLQSVEDKYTVCILLNRENTPLYTIGEAAVLEKVLSDLPSLSTLERQTLMEFQLANGTYSLGIVTPILDASNVYTGSLLSIYDESYLFKIISSYYKIADTSTYICRANGDVINSRPLPDALQSAAIEDTLNLLTFTTQGTIENRVDKVPVSGYYQQIGYSPWYLAGFIDETLVSAFTNQYVLTYIFIIIAVLIADMLLAFYFSHKVVKPINSLIAVMEGYPHTLSDSDLQLPEKNGYYETQYLRTKFLELMQRILLVQHNFEGVYQLYQSGNMSDTNIDIDTQKQTISSNKEVFQLLMNQLQVPPTACIVERFINCFCEKDQRVLMDIFVNMRDRHLSVPCEVEVYTPHMDEKWFHTLVVPMYENDRLSHLFIQLRDISSFKRQELESSKEARIDALTKLCNRWGFSKSVNEALQATDDATALHGFLFLDMDYFKMVNDNLGHHAGDDLLCTVGEALRSSIGDSGLVSRFGGDEFAIFLPNTSREALAQVKELLHKLLVYPFHTDKISFEVTASIGVSIWTHASPYTLEELLQQADIAMYQAKKRLKQDSSL